MTTFLYDGTAFDLTRNFVDCAGVEWVFTGQWTADGEPLMASGRDLSLDGHKAVPLPTVYHDHGPLIPVSTKPRLSVSAWLQPALAEVAA